MLCNILWLCVFALVHVNHAQVTENGCVCADTTWYINDYGRKISFAGCGETYDNARGWCDVTDHCSDPPMPASHGWVSCQTIAGVIEVEADYASKGCVCAAHTDYVNGPEEWHFDGCPDEYKWCNVEASCEAKGLRHARDECAIAPSPPNPPPTPPSPPPVPRPPPPAIITKSGCTCLARSLFTNDNGTQEFFEGCKRLSSLWDEKTKDVEFPTIKGWCEVTADCLNPLWPAYHGYEMCEPNVTGNLVINQDAARRGCQCSNQSAYPDRDNWRYDFSGCHPHEDWCDVVAPCMARDAYSSSDLCVPTIMGPNGTMIQMETAEKPKEEEAKAEEPESWLSSDQGTIVVVVISIIVIVGLMCAVEKMFHGARGRGRTRGSSWGFFGGHDPTSAPHSSTQVELSKAQQSEFRSNKNAHKKGMLSDQDQTTPGVQSAKGARKMSMLDIAKGEFVNNI